MYKFFFFSTNEDIVAMVVDGESDDFGAEKPKGLLKILPEQDEVRSIYDLCSSTFIYSNSNYK